MSFDIIVHRASHIYLSEGLHMASPQQSYYITVLKCDVKKIGINCQKCVLSLKHNVEYTILECNSSATFFLHGMHMPINYLSSNISTTFCNDALLKSFLVNVVVILLPHVKSFKSRHSHKPHALSHPTTHQPSHILHADTNGHKTGVWKLCFSRTTIKCINFLSPVILPYFTCCEV